MAADLRGADPITYSKSIARQADDLYQGAESSWRGALGQAGVADLDPAWVVAAARRHLFDRYDRRLCGATDPLRAACMRWGKRHEMLDLAG